MKKSNNINVAFAKNALALKIHSNCTLKWFMPTRSASNVIFVIIQLSYIQTLENILNVFMKISSNINVKFVKRAMVRKIHLKCILKGFTKIRSGPNVICVTIQL